MSDPNDFTVSLAALIGSMEERVRLGVEQPGSVSAVFKQSITSYELPGDTIGVSRVAGMRGTRYQVFVEGLDYSFGGNRLQWTGTPADEGSRLDIETVWREPPSGITDFNPGSVAGTLMRAVTRELTLMYGQMDQAYRRAFIDDANGMALDSVVALLGVKRIPAQEARGRVSFLRKKAASQAVNVPAGTRVADKAGRVFATLAAAQIRTSAEELRTVAGGRISTTDKIAELIGVWTKAQNPDTAPSMAVAPGFGENERTITPTPPVADDIELRVRYKPRSVSVAVEALQAGPEGNVNAKSLTIMPTPPKDVDAVINEEATSGGQVAEADDRLRERAKHALERAGNATLNAIRFAVLQVEGVQGVEVIDHGRDDSIQLGEVRVRYAGGDPDAVRAAVDGARAAGVMARVEQVTTVSLSGLFYLVPGEPSAANAAEAFVASAVATMNALQIGQALSLRKLQSAAYTLPGLADMAEAQLVAHKPPPSASDLPVTSDPLFVSSSELIRPDAAALRAVMLQAVAVGAHRRIAAGQYEIDIQLRDADGNTPSFHAMSLDLFVAARAHLKSNPTEAALRVGSFTRSVSFANGDTAKLGFTVAGDLTGFDVTQHEKDVEFLISAAAYPALANTVTTVDVTS